VSPVTVLPSVYGVFLLCEDDKIPGHATLIYDVELMEIEAGHRPTNFFGEIDTDGDDLLSQDEVLQGIFLPHDAMHKRSLCHHAVSVRLSACLSVHHVHVFCQNE